MSSGYTTTPSGAEAERHVGELEDSNVGHESSEVAAFTVEGDL